nr:hypothetical protein BaRGS_018052 [Batillaria attramentaria]
MVVSRLFGLRPREQRLLQVSGSATGRELSDKAHYPTFFRVIPPDTIQVQVMLELLEQLDWNYVAIVYDEDDYGRSAATELRRLAEDRQICVPLFESMPVDTRSDEFYTRTSQIAEQIGSTEVGLVRGLVVLGSRRTTKELLSKLNSEVSYIQPILSEAIALQSSSLQTAEGHVIPIARGTLLTSPQYSDLPEFRTFWNQLWADNHTYAEHASRNPWLAGYLQQLTGCDAGDSGCWENAGDKRASLSLADGAAGGGLSLYLWYKVKAIAVMASFLKRLHAKTCGSSFRGVCAALTDAINDRERLLTELKTDPVPLSDLANVTSAFQNVTSVAFDANGDVTDEQGDDQYTVYNFRRGEDGFAFKQVLLDVVVGLGANYIQIIYDSTTTYGTSFFSTIQDEINHGDRYNVCIAQGIPATPREDSTQYSWIVDKLRTKPSARVVIVVLHLVEIEKAMDAILPLLTSSDNFVFLATNSWGRRYELIERRPKLEGSMVLSQELVPDASFQAHFSALDPTVSQNPWLKYFWEKRGNCFFDKSFQRKGKSATRMCEALTSERLVETMHRVQLDLYGTNKTTDIFNDNGDGVVGYKVLQVTRDLTSSEDTVIYREVRLKFEDSRLVICYPM